MATANTNSKLYLSSLFAAVIFSLLFGVSAAMACDFCQQAFQNQLQKGTSGSIHESEMLRLIAASSERELIATTPPAVMPDGTKTDGMPLREVTAEKGRAQKVQGVTQPLLQKSPPKMDALRAKQGKLPATGYVPPGTKPDKKFTIEMQEGETFLGNGVVYKGFLINGKLPGPMFVMDEGDVIEFTVVNKGTVPHGMSIHAAYTQTSKYFGKIQPGETKTHTFRVAYPGVYMYHCAPGGHAIPMHVLMGQYGMMVARPKTQAYRMEHELGKKPDIELYLLQHELYGSGKEAIEGSPLYVMFNGRLFRYAESPVVARPGDFVRIYFLNVGPNLISTFHIVGIVWDYAYWQGLPNPENTFVGGQSVLAGPSDSWIVDFRIPEDEGNYLMLTHAVGAATRGAIGVISAKKDGTRTPFIAADGPEYSAEQLKEYREKAARTVAPFEPGSEDLRYPTVHPDSRTVARILIKGNSYYPKVIEVPVGTTVEWTNEDVFAFADGEFAGIHNVLGISGPDSLVSPMLGHAERFSKKFEKAGEYTYMCTPHPYMRGIVRVVERDK